MLTPDEVLERASKKVLEPGWWVQHHLATWDPESNQINHACAVGTIRLEAGVNIGGSSYSEEGRVADSAQRVLATHVGMPVHLWNDRPERTAEEVATTMRDAAAEYRIQRGRADG